MLACAALAVVAVSSLPAMEIVETEGWEALDKLATEGIEQQVYPGAYLVVGQPGNLIWSKPYGTFTYEEDAASIDGTSLFDLASVSKVVGTTSAALLLLDDGTIALDDLVSKHIPGFEQGGKETVTVKDLMTHTSGLKAYDTWSIVEKGRERGETRADALIRRYASLEVSYEPRTKYTYSCLNFQTLARVVENASGERMEDLLRERVFGPLGMEDTTYILSGEQTNRAVPTQKAADGSTIVAVVHDPLAKYHGSEMHCPGNAGLFSSGPDIAKYCEMIANGGELNGNRIFSEEILALATSTMSPEEVNENRGLGWDVYESQPYLTDLNKTPETSVIGHTGYTGTMIWIDKNTKTYMVFLTNRSYPDDGNKSEISSIRRRLADTILRNLPEYQEYFATLQEDTEEEKSGS